MKLGKLLKRWFNPRPIENYVSSIDQFLEKFDATHPASPTATAEKEKYDRIFYLRDHPVKQDINKIIWKDF